MALPLLSLQYVKDQLEGLGCTKLMDYGTAARWVTLKGYHFTVPQEGPDKQCSKYDFEEILKLIEPHL
jgi:hypothetical protein